MPEQIPQVVVLRLPMYLRALAILSRENQDVVSSRELGARLQVTSAQIRKDLSYFGKFGKQGKGYNVKHLLERLRHILGLDREWAMAIIGMGRLGKALVRYPGFLPQGFRVVAAFDSNPRQIGKKVGGITVQDVTDMESAIARCSVNIAVVAVPAAEAPKVIETLVKCGITAILNYAPVVVQAPNNVQLRDIDPILALQSMTFYLKDAAPVSRSRRGRSRLEK